MDDGTSGCPKEGVVLKGGSGRRLSHGWGTSYTYVYVPDKLKLYQTNYKDGDSFAAAETGAYNSKGNKFYTWARYSDEAGPALQGKPKFEKWLNGEKENQWYSAAPSNYKPDKGRGCAVCTSNCNEWMDYKCDNEWAKYACKMPGNVAPGFYSDQGTTTITTDFGKQYDIKPCPVGKYNDEVQEPKFTSCKDCPAGRFGDIEQLSLSTCSGACDKGYYCEPGSDNYRQHKCRAGRFGSGGSINDDCTGACEPGHYCPAGSTSGTAKKCDPGKYGDATGQTAASCVGTCPAGYSCPAGTSQSTANPCTNIKNHCPAGSAAETVTVSGLYSRPDANGNYFAMAQCPVGHYCVGGEKMQCDAGRYGSASGLQTSGCSGKCTAGYHCPAGSTSATAKDCGSAASYCPEGSDAPIPVRAGYYSACEDGTTTLCPATNRVKELPCDEGKHCVDGLQRYYVDWDPAFCRCGKQRRGDPSGTLSCFPDKLGSYGRGSFYEKAYDELKPYHDTDGSLNPLVNDVTDPVSSSSRKCTRTSRATGSRRLLAVCANGVSVNVLCKYVRVLS